MAAHDEHSPTDLIPDRDLFGMAKQLKSLGTSTLATKLGFSETQWKKFKVLYDKTEEYTQGIFLMLLDWKKRNPTHEEVQKLKRALDELKVNTEGYFQITPEETGERPPKCEECQRYFLNDKGLRGHQGKVQCGRTIKKPTGEELVLKLLTPEERTDDQKSVRIAVTMPYTDNTSKTTVHTLQARKSYTRKHFPSDRSAIGVGLRFFEKQTLENNGSTSITMPHCAIFSEEDSQAIVDTMKLYRYDSQTNKWDGKQLVRPGNGYPNVKLRPLYLELNIKELDDWWILSVINDSNIFKGKRLECTTFVPSELKKDDRDCMDVCLRDDNGFVEDRRPGWKKTCDRKLSVEFGKGPLEIECHQDGQTESPRKEIPTSDFQKFTQHLVTFKLRGIQAVPNTNITLKFRQGATELLVMDFPLRGAVEE